jgi:predicted PurR-regulated permease PerM
LAIASGIGIYLGLSLLELLGWPDFRYKVLIAAIVALFQLIPALGPIIAAIILFLLGLLRSPEMALTGLVLYIAVQQLVNYFVAPHVERRIIDIHPALLLMVIVLLSELGLIWVMLAAPIAAVFRDLFRYVYGRVSDPPQPAGVLPGTPIPILPRSTLFSPFIPHEPKKVPLAYRRGRALRRIQPNNLNQEA